jgi:segregation and condensation protein B
MNSLIDKGLIEACGRLDAPGRPMLYATTEKFLRVFGLLSLSDLPATETILPPKEELPMIDDVSEDEDGGVTSAEEQEPIEQLTADIIHDDKE